MELIEKLERASRDRDYFILNRNRIRDSYVYLDNLLSQYIDICCHTFKTFKVNKTSYVYGSIATIAVGIVLSKEKLFTGAIGGDPIEYLSRDIFPLFVESYNTTSLVEAKTQLHMLKGYIDELDKVSKKLIKYAPGMVDSYLTEEMPDVIKYYLNQIVRYCIDHKLEQFSDKDVIEELLPHLKTINF